LHLTAAALRFFAIQRLTSHPVDGLTEVGFANESHYPLVVSSHGRGVIDGHTGQLVARDGAE
jgi:hypothetical protein